MRESAQPEVRLLLVGDGACAAGVMIRSCQRGALPDLLAVPYALDDNAPRSPFADGA